MQDRFSEHSASGSIGAPIVAPLTQVDIPISSNETVDSSGSGSIGSGSIGQSVPSGSDGGYFQRRQAGSSSVRSGPSSGQLMEKACKQCRSRKVKCDRQWPKCQRCLERGVLDCDFGKMVPAGALANEASQTKQLQGRMDDMEDRLDMLEAYRSTKPGRLAATVQYAFLTGRNDPAEIHAFFGLIRKPNDTSAEWRLAREASAPRLVLHLVDTFFSSCCAYLPVCQPWQGRMQDIRSRINDLEPAYQAAVMGFCAMGARASPHSGFPGVTLDIKTDSLDRPEIIEAGERREMACRALCQQAVLLCSRLEIGGMATAVSLESLMVEIQMLLFEELDPRRSRSLLWQAVGLYKDLLDGPATEAEKLDLVERVALPLFLADSHVAAYARKLPAITTFDLTRYFSRVDLSLQTFGVADLADLLDGYLPRTMTSSANITHTSLVRATTTLACWTACSQREFALLTCNDSISAINTSGIYRLWLLSEQIHEGAKRIQQLLVNMASAPEGCESVGCADLHLRFGTRLDRDLMDITHLLHAHILAIPHTPGSPSRETENSLIRAESERRIRKSLRLTAFYAQLYVTSHDRHMCYHLVWQLELLPQWVGLIVQRYGEVPGPQAPELEVTETELDWFTTGLRVAAFYHPVGKRRLRELEQWRRPARPQISY